MEILVDLKGPTLIPLSAVSFAVICKEGTFYAVAEKPPAVRHRYHGLEIKYVFLVPYRKTMFRLGVGNVKKNGHYATVSLIKTLPYGAIYANVIVPHGLFKAKKLSGKIRGTIYTRGYVTFRRINSEWALSDTFPEYVFYTSGYGLSGKCHAYFKIVPQSEDTTVSSERVISGKYSLATMYIIFPYKSGAEVTLEKMSATCKPMKLKARIRFNAFRHEVSLQKI